MPQTENTQVQAASPNPFYYTALIRVPTENIESSKGRYCLITTELSASELDAYNRGEDIKAQFDEAIAQELNELSAEVAQLQSSHPNVKLNLNTLNFLSGVESDYLSNAPTSKFKFTKKFMLDVVEKTDLVASTPHRLLLFFKPDFMPDTTYFWLFIGLVIGDGLISLARTLAAFLGMRRTTRDATKEVAKSSTTFEVCNSTISWGNPIPPEPASRTTKIEAWTNYAFKFLFSFSLWYWIIWSIAEVTIGAGFAVVPFSPLIAFLLPLAFTLVQKFADPVVNYVFNKEANASDKSKLNFAILEKLRLLDEAVGHKDTQSLQEHLNYIDKILEQYENQNLGSNKTLINKPSIQTQRTRIALNTLLGFGKGFMMTTLIFFALSAFMGTGLVAVIIPIIAAGVMGILYAAKAFRDSSQVSIQHNKAFQNLEERNAHLLDKLNRFYQIILAERQKASTLSESLGEKFIPFVAAADNPDFMLKSKLELKGWYGQVWRTIKKITHRFIIFVGATEAGSFIFRAIFGLVAALTTLGLASNPLSLTAIGIIMVLVAVGWGIAKLCHHWSQNIIAQEKLFLTQSEVYIRALSQEHQYLEKQILASEDIIDMGKEPSLASRHTPSGEAPRRSVSLSESESFDSLAESQSASPQSTETSETTPLLDEDEDEGTGKNTPIGRH